MKKKESLWQLLKDLDEQSAQYNTHLTEANRLFDHTAKKMKDILAREQKQLDATISKVKSALKKFAREANGSGKKNPPAGGG